MAEDKVLQSTEELGLKSESSSGERKHISTNCGMHWWKDGQIDLIFFLTRIKMNSYHGVAINKWKRNYRFHTLRT